MQYKLESSFLNFFYFFNPYVGCKMPYKSVEYNEVGIYRRVFLVPFALELHLICLFNLVGYLSFYRL